MAHFILLMFAVLLLAFCPAARGAAAGVDLAALEDWDIVVAEDALPSEQYAAEELQTHFQLAAGLRLPIVHTADRPGRHVFVGAGDAMRSSPVGFDAGGMGAEDLRIVVRDENIAIAGGRPRGT
ncbi:MAG: hypothetical protein KAX44_05725, partial [Candidatus Brocadiae bacterium]|nr:hypothetical protein [Candidatus Brocadiia bacterium]